MMKNLITIGFIGLAIGFSPISIANLKKEVISDKTSEEILESGKFANIPFKKEMMPFSEVEQAAVEYDQALTLLNQGEESEAIELLRGVLKKTPVYHPARLQLIKLYKKEGLYFDVENLLEDGLKMDDRHPEYLKHMAGVLQEKDEHKQALSLLLQVPTEAQFTKEYKAMLAVSYFHEGVYSSSIKYYTSLVREDARNSTWWLGLAVSQDAAEKQTAALKSFSHVKRLGRLEADVLKYVNERIEKISQNSQTS